MNADRAGAQVVESDAPQGVALPPPRDDWCCSGESGGAPMDPMVDGHRPHLDHGEYTAEGRPTVHYEITRTSRTYSAHAWTDDGRHDVVATCDDYPRLLLWVESRVLEWMGEERPWGTKSP